MLQNFDKYQVLRIVGHMIHVYALDDELSKLSHTLNELHPTFLFFSPPFPSLLFPPLPSHLLISSSSDPSLLPPLLTSLPSLTPDVPKNKAEQGRTLKKFNLIGIGTILLTSIHHSLYHDYDYDYNHLPPYLIASPSRRFTTPSVIIRTYSSSFS